MPDKREKRYAIRMTEMEMEIVNEVSEHYNLPNLVRKYITKLHKDIQLFQEIGRSRKDDS